MTRLEEIKKEWALACFAEDAGGVFGDTGLGGWRATRDDINWLIEQAEKVQELERQLEKHDAVFAKSSKWGFPKP